MNTTTFQDVITFLNTEKLTTEQLSRVSSIVHERFKSAQARASRELWVGDRVTWRGKFGETLTGKVTKVNRMTIHCVTDAGIRWRVSPTLVTHV